MFPIKISKVQIHSSWTIDLKKKKNHFPYNIQLVNNIV